MTDILKEIKQKIDNLEEIEQREIFKLIRDSDTKYTTNSNGVFINMNLFNRKLITDILNFLEFSEKNKVLLEERDTLQNYQLNQIEESI